MTRWKIVASFAFVVLSTAALSFSPDAASTALVDRAVARSAESSRTVFLVRHAETAASTTSTRDPELSEGGQKRARDLARLLSHAGVTHVFSSEYRRTQATAAPLAKEHELETTIVSARDSAAQLEALRALPSGSVALVCGHSNTIPALVRELGGDVSELEEHPQYGPVLDHSSYDRLFTVVLPPATASEVDVSTIELRYGDPSPKK